MTRRVVRVLPELYLSLAQRPGGRPGGRPAEAAEHPLESDGPVEPEAVTAVEAGSRRAGQAEPVLDPLDVFQDGGEEQRQLAMLEVEQLHAIIRRHGMDHDRRALRWRDRSRLVQRVMDHTVARASWGSSLR